MKALTIRQPWASLIAHGIKTIETRSWKTSYRGPIAIHAGAHRPMTVCHGNVNDPLPDAVDLVVMGRHWDFIEDVNDYTAGGWYRWIGPLGAVVATATLADCAPIGGPHSFRTGHVDGDEGDFPGQSVVVLHPPLHGEDLWTLIHDADGRQYDITEQLPYGDYQPGRFAWLLTDVSPIDPVPAKGRQGLWNWEPT